MQTQIRLLHLIRVCTISYSAVLNKHKRKYGDDWAEIFEHTLCIQIILLHLIRVCAIFCSTFSNNLAILLAISDTTADQTAPSNQGLHDKLFCRHSFKQTRNKIRWWFDPKYWAEIFEHILCIQITLLHLIRVYAIFYSTFSINLATLMCLSIGTPKTNKFSICSKWKIYYF